jgi:hypothetical protein
VRKGVHGMRIKELYLYVIPIILIVAIVSGIIIIPAAHNDAYSNLQEYQRDAILIIQIPVKRR